MTSNPPNGPINELVSHLEKISKLPTASVILVGSAARGTQTWRSDVDALVVTPSPIQDWKSPSSLHVVRATRKTFLERVEERDDFAAWALRHGKVISDRSGWWAALRASSAAKMWPRWEPKLALAASRLAMAGDLLKMGDHDAAEEELLVTASQLARAMLIREHIFPLSRAELPEQLARLGDDRLAAVLEQLIRGQCSLSDLKPIAGTLTEYLERLKSETSVVK